MDYKHGKKNEDEASVYVVPEEEEVFTPAHGLREEEGVVDPFCRRSSLARTPPLERQIFLPTLPSERTDRDRGKGEEKRKRPKESPIMSIMTERVPREAGKDEDKRFKLLEAVKDLIRSVDAGVENLYSITSVSRNTKVEIKEEVEEVEKLVVLMKKLTSKDIGKLARVGVTRQTETREIGVQADLGVKVGPQKEVVADEAPRSF